MYKLLSSSIRVKLIVVFMLWSLAPLLILKFVIFPIVVQSAFEQTVIQNLRGVGHKQKEFVFSWMRERKDDAFLLATDPYVRDFYSVTPNSEEYRKLLARLEVVRDTHGYKEIIICGGDGGVFASTEKESVGIQMAGYDYFQEAIKGKTFVSQVKPSTVPVLNEFGEKESGVPVFFISAPIRDEKYNVRGVLALQVDRVFLSREMRKVKLGETGETYLVNKDGFMITESKFIPTIRQMGLINKRTSLELKVVDPNTGRLTRAAEQCLKGREGYDARGYPDYRGVPVLGVWHWLPEYQWGVISEMDVEEAYAAIYGLDRNFFYIFIGLFTGLVLVSFYVSRKITVPLINVNEATKKIASGDYAQRLDVTSADELGELARSFNAMGKTLEEKECINNFNRIIASSLLTEVFGAASSELEKLIDFDRISITSFREKEESFFLTFVLSKDNVSDELAQGTRSRKDGSLFEQVLSTGKPVIVDDTETGQLWSDKVLLKEGIRSRMAYPLITYKGDIIGAVNFGSKKPGSYSEKDFNILSQVVPQLVVVLENAKIIDRLQESQRGDPRRRRVE